MTTSSNYTITNSAVTFNFPTFTKTPDCGILLSYTILVDGQSAKPDWFISNNTTFSISTFNRTFAGVHNISITTNTTDLFSQ
jgi:hypothetical protein